jgi:PilZ domain
MFAKPIYAQKKSTLHFTPGRIEDRCSQRNDVHIVAQLRPSGGRSFTVIVNDISMAGFSCEAITTMRTGARCFLTIPGLESQQAEVVWNNGIIVGCAFSSLMHPTVVERIARHYRSLA